MTLGFRGGIDFQVCFRESLFPKLITFSPGEMISQHGASILRTLMAMYGGSHTASQHQSADGES